MRPEVHLSVVEAEVRGMPLARHAGVQLDRGHVFALAGGMGLPRLWGFVTRAALEGFQRGLEGADAAADRLFEAVEGAHRRLTERCDTLIERITPDATLVALHVDHSHLHVISVGPGRVYLQRRGKPQRLTPRDDPNDGLLKGAPVRCSVDIHPGDLVLAGSVSAFSVKAVGKLASVLEADAKAPPSVLASLLTEPAARAGVGAAALAMRVR